MERVLRGMVETHRLQSADLGAPKLRKREYLKEFGDLLLHHHQEKDADKYTFDTFDNEEMCKCVTAFNGFSSTHCKAAGALSSARSREAVHGGSQDE